MLRRRALLGWAAEGGCPYAGNFSLAGKGKRCLLEEIPVAGHIALSGADLFLNLPPRNL
jgi:hypothetical protein